MRAQTKIVIALLAVLLVGGSGVTIWYFLNKEKAPEQPLETEKVVDEGKYPGIDYSIKKESVVLPENVFDKEDVFVSGITYKYPAKGFYGLGADVVKISDFDMDYLTGLTGEGITIQPTGDFDVNKQSEYVVLNMIVFDDTKGISDFEDFKKKNPGLDYFLKSNEVKEEVKTINGKEFLIFKIAEDVTTWRAFVKADVGYIFISFSYTTNDAAESQLAYENNDKLFAEFLENIRFE